MRHTNDPAVDGDVQMTEWTKADIINAHKFCCNHMAALKKDKVCGCFYCLKVFSPSEIKEWLISEDERNLCDRYGTAICPHCGIDSVIGESSGYPITKEFLTAMMRYWFG